MKIVYLIYQIEKLPNSIQYIKFGNNFNQFINCPIPKSLKIIELISRTKYKYTLNHLPKYINIKLKVTYGDKKCQKFITDLYIINYY